MPAGTTAADGHRSFGPVRALALGAAGAMALAVFVGAESAGAAGLFPGPWLDKIAHAVYYGTMALLLDHGLGQRSPATAIVLAALVGVADERHQLGVVGRDASWQDAVADLLGALAAVASRRAFVRRG
ncbi:MAG TPA: VanZ family protein [Casimicrobiaceae bacterium]|jgi:hypothetical protein|nr:VanZ family protein [Casimicrobiaceae bacterium]